jgi:hypothetical protein
VTSLWSNGEPMRTNIITTWPRKSVSNSFDTESGSSNVQSHVVMVSHIWCHIMRSWVCPKVDALSLSPGKFPWKLSCSASRGCCHTSFAQRNHTGLAGKDVCHEAKSWLVENGIPHGFWSSPWCGEYNPPTSTTSSNYYELYQPKGLSNSASLAREWLNWENPYKWMDFGFLHPNGWT